MKPSLSWSLLCSLFLSKDVVCVPLNDSLVSTNGCNLTAWQPTSILTEARIECTTSVAWTGAEELSAPFFHDCGTAFNNFFKDEYCPHRVSEFEFLNEASVPVHHNPEQRTPRRYIWGELRQSSYL